MSRLLSFAILLSLVGVEAHAAVQCKLVMGANASSVVHSTSRLVFHSSDELRGFHLKGLGERYPEILKLNGLEFVKEEAIDHDPKNGFTIYIKYLGEPISFPVSADRRFVAKSQSAIEGAIRAIEMKANPGLIPTGATQSTHFVSANEIKKLPLSVQRWIESERDRLSRDVDTNLTSGFTPERNFQERAFTPEEARVFEIEGHWLPEAKLEFVMGSGKKSDLASRMQRVRNGKREFLLLVHPETKEYFKPLLRFSTGREIFYGTPSASSRSVLVWQPGQESKPFVAKMSLDRQIGNIVRLIDRAEVAKAMLIDQVIADSEKEFPKDIVFIREVAGMIPRGSDLGGTIIRELPSWMLEGETTFIPLFALYGTSERQPKPLLVDMINKSGMPTADYIREKIIAPIARQWVEMAVNHGLLMEPHAQNAMIEVTSDARATGRFGYRDFGGFTFDLKLRERLGLKNPVKTGFVDPSEALNAEEHHGHFKKSLLRYLEGGFLSQLEAKTQAWAKSSQPKLKTGLPSGFAREALLSEIEKELEHITGRRIHLERDYSNLNKLMTELTAEQR